MEKVKGQRRRYTRAEIAAVVKAFQESGASKNAFAGEIGVSWMTLHRWVESMEEPSLIPVRVMESPARSNDLWPEFVMGTGLRLRIPPGTSAAVVSQLLQGWQLC